MRPTQKSTAQTSKPSKKDPETSLSKPLLTPKPTSTVSRPSTSLPQHAKFARPGKLAQSNASKFSAKTDTPNKRPKLLSFQPSQGKSRVQDKKTTHKTAINLNLVKVESTNGQAVTAQDQVGTI